MRPNRHEVCGIYVNSSIMDEGAIVKTSSLTCWEHIPFQCDFTRLIWNIWCYFHSQIFLRQLSLDYIIVTPRFHLPNGWVYVDTTNPWPTYSIMKISVYILTHLQVMQSDLWVLLMRLLLLIRNSSVHYSARQNKVHQLEGKVGKWDHILVSEQYWEWNVTKIRTFDEKDWIKTAVDNIQAMYVCHSIHEIEAGNFRCPCTQVASTIYRWKHLQLSLWTYRVLSSSQHHVQSGIWCRQILMGLKISWNIQ